MCQILQQICTEKCYFGNRNYFNYGIPIVIGNKKHGNDINVESIITDARDASLQKTYDSRRTDIETERH